jgi:LDH2 family malate/lactate/ureidoglycolate dehydrogenase
LALVVENLSAVLSGAAWGGSTDPKTPGGVPPPANLGHAFLAIKVESFRPLDEFKRAMDGLLCYLREGRKASGATRIYTAGEKEFEEARRRSAEGIALEPRVEADLRALAEEVQIEF